MIFSVSGVQKAFGTNTILEDVTFLLEDKEKVALVGLNGAGKTTLFKIITNEISKDKGTVVIAKEKTIGYLEQIVDLETETSIYEEIVSVFSDLIKMEDKLRKIELEMASLIGEDLEKAMAQYSSLSHEFEIKKGYEYKSRVKGVAKGLGFQEDEFERPVRQLSGGEKTRVALGKLLLKEPDLLLLDEPTNHLDIQAVQWLEDFLKNYEGSIIIISHDRYFLDKVTTKTIEIENKQATVYNGNYTFFTQQKEINREIMLKQYLNQQKEIKRQEEIIKELKSFNREKTVKRARSKEKLLQKIEVIEKPKISEQKMKLNLTPKNESGNDVLRVREVSKSFGGNKLFNNINFEVQKGEKVALIGENGIGKTTLFKIIMGTLESDTGEAKIGASVKIGYYDQEHENLSLGKNIFDEISDKYPNLTNVEIRNALASFAFKDDDVFKPVSALSGGERGRVALSKIMLGNVNFLILDEPTNHLDIYSKEILEKAIKGYEGTVIYISHDRYFINNTATKIIELTKDGCTIYLGNYDYYIEKKTDLNKIQPAKNDISVSVGKDEYIQKKESQAEIRKVKNQLKKTENEIEQIEINIKDLENELLSPEVCTNAQKAKEIYEKKVELEERLESLYELWEQLSI